MPRMLSARATWQLLRAATRVPGRGRPVEQLESALTGDEIVTVVRSLTTRPVRSEEHTSELQSRQYLVCRLLLEKKTSDTPPSLLYGPHEWICGTNHSVPYCSRPERFVQADNRPHGRRRFDADEWSPGRGGPQRP